MHASRLPCEAAKMYFIVGGQVSYFYQPLEEDDSKMSFIPVGDPEECGSECGRGAHLAVAFIPMPYALAQDGL